MPQSQSSSESHAAAPAGLAELWRESHAVEKPPIDLKSIVVFWWRMKWVMLIVAVVAGVWNVDKVKAFQPQYIARMVVAPESEQKQAAVPGVLGAIVGGSQSESPFDRVMRLVSSYEVARIMDEKYGYLRKIYGANWDEQSQSWAPPNTPEFKRNQEFLAETKRNTWQPPSYDSLAGYFGGVVRLDTSGNAGGGVAKVVAYSEDPEEAQFLLKELLVTADSLVRDMERERLDHRRAYLMHQLNNTKLVKLKGNLVNMLTDLEREYMDLQKQGYYTFRVIEPVRLLPHRTEPNLTKTFVLPIGVSVVLSIVFITIFAVFYLEE